MTKIMWVSIAGPGGKNAIDEFINANPSYEILNAINLGADIGILYNEGKVKKEKGKKQKKKGSEDKSSTKSRKFKR
jgi:hypothetical protein